LLVLVIIVVGKSQEALKSTKLTMLYSTVGLKQTLTAFLTLRTEQRERKGVVNLNRSITNASIWNWTEIC